MVKRTKINKYNQNFGNKTKYIKNKTKMNIELEKNKKNAGGKEKRKLILSKLLSLKTDKNIFASSIKERISDNIYYAKQGLNINCNLKKETQINKKDYNKKNYRTNYKTCNIFSKLIILYIIELLLPINNLCFINFQYSKISLKIKGNGTKNILGSPYGEHIFDTQYYPNEVYINGEKQNTVNYSYEFDQEDNYVELIWNDNVNNCQNMFRQCKDITEFDFSNFDTSNVENMYCMFQSCSSLTSLNISNFNTTKVKDMSGMFQYCYNLTSLNLSNFNTSQVNNMEAMFDNCKSLTSLNLSNFDTSRITRMSNMFKGCSSLTSLNLSNFDTSKVTRIQKMFYDCINLEYINLGNLNENTLNDDKIFYEDIFYKVPDNAVLCLKEENTKNKIYPQFNKIKCKLNYCKDDWKSNQNKLIEKTNVCIDKCESNSIYKYEYNGKLFIWIY